MKVLINTLPWEIQIVDSMSPELTVGEQICMGTTQAENTELRAELTHKTELVYRQANELERLIISTSLLVELEKVNEELKQTRNELEQVKHQLDSYRAYYDDMASKPNCNTCADKDCKYRPIPGETVRANCLLWSGPDKED